MFLAADQLVNKCEKYWADANHTVSFSSSSTALSVRTTSEGTSSAGGGVTRRRITITTGANNSAKTDFVQYHYDHWPDFGVPDNPETLVRLVGLVREDLRSRDVCLVHCSAGVGRSGTFLALYKIMGEIDAGAEDIDVYQTVLAMRGDRAMMVRRLSATRIFVKCGMLENEICHCRCRSPSSISSCASASLTTSGGGGGGGRMTTERWQIAFTTQEMFNSDSATYGRYFASQCYFPHVSRRLRGRRPPLLHESLQGDLGHARPQAVRAAEASPR